MATAKKTATKSHTVSIPATQVMAALARFGTLCDYVERDMRRSDVGYPATEAPQPSKLKGAPLEKLCSVEQTAYEVRNFAQDIQKAVEDLRAKLCYGGGQGQAVGENNSVAPSMGPIKDTLNATQCLLASIHRDLIAISDYISN